RYSRGDTVNGLTLTGMGYSGRWSATDQVPQRAIESGTIDRFGAIDPSDGGDAYRYSGTIEWQRSRGPAATKGSAYRSASDLDLFSNFTFFLDDPVNGDQFEQRDHRYVTGGKLTHRRIGRWANHETQNVVGAQVRNDDITSLGLYHTVRRVRLGTTR